MTASRRRTVIVWVAALGVASVLALAAATGPSGVVGDVRTQQPTVQTPAETSRTTHDSDEHVHQENPPPGRAGELDRWLHDLLAFALLAAFLGLATTAGRMLVLRLTRELPDKQLVLDLDPLPDVEAGREALRSEQERYAAALAHAADVRNGIVACWVLLEETAERVGLARRPAETATEFVVRFLHALDVDPRPVAALATLYHEARFSTHPMSADARGRAERALADLRAGLGWRVPT